MDYVQEISLELNSNAAYTTVGAKQGDSYTRQILAHITADGIPWTIPNNVTASYRIRKPDGTAIWNNAEIKDNAILITLTEESLSVAGRAYADVVLYANNNNRAEVLSTISFIIIIMSSPNISKTVASSNEFGYIQQVVDDANVILTESESWAKGTRKGVPVIGDTFVSEITSGNFTYSINENEFRQHVGIFSGQIITWTLKFIGGNVWELLKENYAERVTADEIGLSVITGTPDINSTIIVTVSDSDLQWQNNAKYWSDTAKISKQSIENLQAEVVETLTPDKKASVVRKIIDNVSIIYQPEDYNIKVNKTTFLNKVNKIIGYYNFYYQKLNWTLDGIQIKLSDYGISNIKQNPQDGDFIIIECNNYTKLNFSIPKGDVGDTNFMTLYIDPEDGILYMNRPVALENKISFEINNNGYLDVIIESGEEGGN